MNRGAKGRNVPELVQGGCAWCAVERQWGGHPGAGTGLGWKGNPYPQFFGEALKILVYVKPI
jgi:hypothetical protein